MELIEEKAKGKTLKLQPKGVPAATDVVDLMQRLKESVAQSAQRKAGKPRALPAQGTREAAKKANIPLTQTRVGSMLTSFFTPGPVVDWNSAKLSDTKRYGQFFNKMLEQGIYLAPSQFEAAFLSTAHSSTDIEKTIRAAHTAFKSL